MSKSLSIADDGKIVYQLKRNHAASHHLPMAGNSAVPERGGAAPGTVPGLSMAHKQAEQGRLDIQSLHGWGIV
jgi:hypothetical protein